MPLNHKIRTNRKTGIRKVKLTPLKAIRFQCLECMGFQQKFIEECIDTLCPLYHYRMGKTKIQV